MRVVVVGAGGRIGSAVVDALRERHDVLSASRSTEPAIDVTDADSIAQFFSVTGTVDAIIVCVGAVPFKPIVELSREDYVSAFLGKALAQIDIVRLGRRSLREGGSITLTTGILAREPVLTGAAAAMANGALESFVLTAAAELHREIRLNAVSPSVLAEASAYHSTFPGFVPVPAAVVAQAYVKSVEGIHTGRIFFVQ